MKGVYAVICERFDGRYYYASVLHISWGTNVCHVCEKYKETILSLTICSTKKEAQRIADSWNETFRKDGTLQEWQTLTVHVRKEGL